MKRGKYKRKVDYIEGYDHYDKVRTCQVIFLLSEAEKACLEDMVAASGFPNISAFIRKQIFKAYNDMTPEQKQQLREVAEWRKDNDRA